MSVLQRLTALFVEKIREPKVREREPEVPKMTFGTCGDENLAIHEVGKSVSYGKNWRQGLEVHAKALRGVPVDEIQTGHVLRPIWTSLNPTAKLLRGQSEAVLDWAEAKGLRQGANPAVWRGRIKYLLPVVNKSVKHFPAMDYREVPSFMEDLRRREGIVERALEFVILTAARRSEAVSARWNEIDFDARVWTIPASRMKAGREHRVPLSSSAVALLEGMPRFTDERIFPVSQMSSWFLLRRIRLGDATVHGFRSSFRDWAGDRTAVQREVVEAALAHVVGDRAEQAYRRGDALEKRRALMEAWATYCGDCRPASGSGVKLYTGY